MFTPATLSRPEQIHASSTRWRIALLALCAVLLSGPFLGDESRQGSRRRLCSRAVRAADFPRYPKRGQQKNCPIFCAICVESTDKLFQQTFQIENPSETKPLAFKIKTTNPKQYCVRPNVGVIQPGSSQEIEGPIFPRISFLTLSSLVAAEKRQISDPRDGGPTVFPRPVLFLVPICKHSNRTL